MEIKIKSIDTKRQMGGTWVAGTVGGFGFLALVFPKHADNPRCEIGKSLISKMEIRGTTGYLAYNWDRGLDVKPENAETKVVLALLCKDLARLTFENPQVVPQAAPQVDFTIIGINTRDNTTWLQYVSGETDPYAAMKKGACAVVMERGGDLKDLAVVCALKGRQELIAPCEDSNSLAAPEDMP